MNIGSTQVAGEGKVMASSRTQPLDRLAKAELQVETQKPATTQPVDRGSVEKAALVLQDFAQEQRRNINFSVDEGNGQVVVKVTDPTSGDLIRQIPSEEALQIAESLDAVRSLLFKAEA